MITAVRGAEFVNDDMSHNTERSLFEIINQVQLTRNETVHSTNTLNNA
jgi:hypothetical protein